MSPPVLVLYKSDASVFSLKLSKIWDPIVTKLRSIIPDLRFHTINLPKEGIGFNNNISPDYLRHYIRWTPMVFLVPGQVWDTAMVDTHKSIPIKDGVHIMNGRWESDRVVFEKKYNYFNIDDYGRWLTEAVNGYIVSKDIVHSEKNPIYSISMKS